MNITLRQMTYFEALAETRNFGLAAARMHISQPALSMQIKDLEAALGGALVERLPRDVGLTRKGRAVLDQVRTILTSVRELESAARRDALGGQLNLGVIPTVAPYLLPTVLEQLQSQHSLAGMRIREAQTDLLMDELMVGKLDAIVIARPDPNARLVIADLFWDQFLLAGHERRLARIGSGVDDLRPVDVDPDQLLLLDEGHCLADQALEVCALDRRQMQINLGASSLSTLCRLVAADHGLTFLPELALEAEANAAPGLAVRRFSAPAPGRQLSLVRRATSAEDGWFASLAAVFQTAGDRLVARTR
ncbi:hydrogen peroxide-inducible genes activator [Pseudoruegeria sp. SK021]|uniref:hydrogen peroxide-inducible genes activator n=1 Tax=Pseudoruegeria sp. SK021 TaxID=1933035 RepID=UPI000A21AFA2|nr:hydrogen peroxide-inducible genes activator [Pseudoruegeria sp. SK021]OSP55249.1 LysR family transcriptional regulator [Pseudoruegeria sp. SK021]